MTKAEAKRGPYVLADFIVDEFFRGMYILTHENLKPELLTGVKPEQVWVTRTDITIGEVSQSKVRLLSIYPGRIIQREEFSTQSNSGLTAISHLFSVWDDISGNLVRFRNVSLQLKKGEVIPDGTVREVEDSVKRLWELTGQESRIHGPVIIVASRRERQPHLS